jgi:ABC-type dipeptide/oligopeptide/nickel transport system ATPase component
MIISIRGTSGSGKSHLARRIMAMYPGQQDVMAPKRKKPIMSVFTRDPPTGAILVVLGHYQIANGGIDTIGDLNDVYNTIRTVASTSITTGAMDVLYEGMNMGDGTTNFMQLVREGHDARIVHLTTPLEQCVEGVRARGHKIAAASIEKTMRKVDSNVKTFRALRVPNVFAGDREACFNAIKWWLKL